MLSRSSMTDEELGKRDDNYRPSKSASTSVAWMPSRNSSGSGTVQQRWRKRRLLIYVLSAVALYLFFTNMPTTYVAEQRAHDATLRGQGRGSQTQQYGLPRAPKGAPPRAGGARPVGKGSGDVEEQEHYYSGPIKFYKLKATLDSISHTGGYRTNNRNILFAASSLQSAASLLPLVCEMAKVGDNHVHLVLLGRASLDLDVLLEVNGVNKKECSAYFHDGRPDYSEYSTDVRAEASVVGALNHIQAWMHPQAVVVDDERLEDVWFTRAVRRKWQDFDRPVIEIPAGMHDDFKWIARLDSASLLNWHKPRIEILIRSPANSGGGLLRLLKSLEAVNFGGFRTPKLTIDLPHKIDGYLREYLENLRWPASQHSADRGVDLLKAQRRIPNAVMSAEESSVRFVESFYPSRGSNDHVLLLSPNTVLSPQTWHYLMYTLLQSRYSAYGGLERERLAGLSLSSPRFFPNGKTEFVPPSMKDMRGKATSYADSIKTPPFLWSAAYSDATLIFGDRWAEFHDYLTRRLYSHHKYPKTSKQKRVLSSEHPVWLEFFHELMAARAWHFLYPADSSAGTWATIHTELPTRPDDLARTNKPSSTSDSAEAVLTPASEPFLTADPAPSLEHTAERTTISSAQPLYALLPFPETATDPLPSLSDIPSLSFTGEVQSSDDEAETAAVAAVKDLRQRIGGCEAEAASRPRKILQGQTGDLFCFKDADSAEAQAWEVQDVDYNLFIQGEEEMTQRVKEGMKRSQATASKKKQVKVTAGEEDEEATSVKKGGTTSAERPADKEEADAVSKKK